MAAEGSEIQFIQTVVTILTVGTGLGFLCHWLRLPLVLGFILTGAIVGPSGLGILSNTEYISFMAHIGIIFLLFIVGLELSIAHLRQMRVQALVAGIFQLGLTTIALTLLFLVFGVPLQPAFLMGSILSLSSTAIVLKAMEDAGELDTVHGRVILGVLIIQDLSIVPLMTLIPSLAEPLAGDILPMLLTIGMVLLKAGFFLAIAVLASIKLIPPLLDRLASTNNREIFTLSVVGIGIGIAMITGYIGLSFEAGAFIAGFALSGSIFSRQIIADSRPFRDVFTTIFFVSVGMMLDIQFLFEHWPKVLGFAAIIMLIKALMAFGAVKMLGFPVHRSLWAGLTLFQVGEFSFVLIHRLMEFMPLDATGRVMPWGLEMGFWNPMIINTIVLSMFLTPLVIRRLPHLLYRLKEYQGEMAESESKGEELPAEKVIIGGYGPVARNLSKVLGRKGVPYVIIELNAETIKTLKAQKVPCVYGDASREEVLEAAGVHDARILALTFPDVRTSEVALQRAKHMNPHIQCIVRTRYAQPIEALYSMRADQVIYEEFETGIAFIFKTLQALGYPREFITQVLAAAREKDSTGRWEISDEDEMAFGRLSVLADTKIEWLELKPDSPMVGKTLAESRIREETGANVISVIEHTGQRQLNPAPHIVLHEKDILVAIGTIEQLKLLEAKVSSPPDPNG